MVTADFGQNLSWNCGKAANWFPYHKLKLAAEQSNGKRNKSKAEIKQFGCRGMVLCVYRYKGDCTSHNKINSTTGGWAFRGCHGELIL